MKYNKKFISIILLLFLVVGIGYTLADVLENDVEVERNSDLTYYLNINYDGVDIEGLKSSDANVSELNSGILYVTDKLPDGLTFNGFVVSDNGTIGAVERNNLNVPCLGKVVDDTNEEGNDGLWNDDNTEFVYHGLHYNKTTNTVSFKVDNLKAGCVLTVGIKTKTPSSIDDPNTPSIEKRRDFYNYGVVREKSITAFSNIVHTFMGKEDLTLYNVNYEYTGDIPANAPSLPMSSSYIGGTNVLVASDMYAEGYTFNGWTSDDVVIDNGSFIVPDSDVTIKGSFTPIPKYKVTYNLDGISPSDYVVPLEKEYYPGMTVYVDSIKDGDIFNGYIFKGWTSENIDISNYEFMMPAHDILITGHFEKARYKVIYQFQGSILPDNSDILLPEIRTYNAGDTVTLDDIDDALGYTFLGWYSDSKFVMPEHDVIIYGEWKKQNGTFEPIIDMEVIDEKEFYYFGDVIKYKVTITNPSEYLINNMLIQKSNKDTSFVTDDFEINGQVLTIDSLSSGESLTFYLQHKVLATDNEQVIDTIDLVGALSDNYISLLDKDYRVTETSLLQPKLIVCANVTGIDVGNIFQVKVDNDNFESWLIINSNECNTLYLEPGIYNISEIIPQEYVLNSISGDVNPNNSNLSITFGHNYQVNLDYRFKNKKFMHAFGQIVNQILGGH